MTRRFQAEGESVLPRVLAGIPARGIVGDCASADSSPGPNPLLG
jgi:hypothetical protein